MSDAIKARQEQVELCRDLLLSTIHENLTLYRQAILRLIEEHNNHWPVSWSWFGAGLADISATVAGDITDISADVIHEMSHAIEEEDAESS